MKENHQHEENLSRGLLYCFVLVVFTVSVVGFLTGTNVRADHLSRPHTVVPEPSRVSEVPQARAYRELRDTARGPGSGWGKSRQVAGNVSRPKTPDAAVEAALRLRQTHRAYDGAPPTIPHHVTQNSAAECLACHREGLRLGAREAGLVPHDELVNCNQCHVPEQDPGPVPPLGGNLSTPPSVPPRGGNLSLARDPRNVPNSFVGLAPPRQGPRAWNIAPPQIPHTTFMRENCLSCHGPSGHAALRTSHDTRQSCTQCHASSAALDLRPGVP